MFGAAFPVRSQVFFPTSVIISNPFEQLFASDMYEVLDPRWASSLLGFIAITMVPIPFVLQKYSIQP